MDARHIENINQVKNYAEENQPACKYITENLEGTIDLRRKKKKEIIDLLIAKGYDMIDNDVEFKYLVKMPMDSVSEENVEKIMKQKDDKEKELTKFKKMKPTDLWNQELDELLHMF